MVRFVLISELRRGGGGRKGKTVGKGGPIPLFQAAMKRGEKEGKEPLGNFFPLAAQDQLGKGRVRSGKGGKREIVPTARIQEPMKKKKGRGEKKGGKAY